VGACDEGVLAVMVRMVSKVDLHMTEQALWVLNTNGPKYENSYMLTFEYDVVTEHVACFVSRQ
jgi:hypothetical protein